MFLQICKYLHNLQIKYGGKDMKKILSIILILLLAVLCLGSCVNPPDNGGSSTTPSTTKPTTTTPVEEKYTLSFEAEGIESLEVVDGKAIGNLPAVPENPGYTGLWKIDGEVINAGTIYNYGEDKTAVPFYIAKDDTVYTVQVFIQVEDSYEDVSAQYAQLFGESVGTTGATVDISELAQANLPEHCVLNTEESVLSGTIAGDGSLVLKVYYDLDGAFVLSFDVEGVSSLPVKFGEPMTNLPAVPAKVGYTGVWKIADEVITSETVYNYNGNRTATAVYTANTDTPYTVEVYMNGTNVSFDFGTQFGMPCVGTTDTLVDISALAQANVPAHCALDESNSVLTGTIAGDGSLVLKVYYYNTDTVIFDAVADTNVVLDYEVRYGADEYSHRVQFHRTAWNGTVQFKLNGNRPVAPEGTTHVTFYYYTAHTSYNSVLNAAGKEITVGNYGTLEWKSFKLSIAQYNEAVWTLTDPQGNSQGKYIYLSNPVFTTESQVWDGISTTTDVVYGTDEFSYTFNSNPTFTATKVLLNMLGDADAISFYIRGTIAAPFNFVVFDPWDANTNLANTVAGEWVKFTLTREQVLNLVNNPGNYYLQIRSWDGGSYYISSSYETYSAPLFEALTDTSVEADTLNVYGDQAESYRVKFHATAWNGTVTFKLNQSKLPAIPEEATHVSIWYYMDHVTYNGCTLKIGSKTVVMENAEPYGWKEIRMTVAEYQSLISETWHLQDANGNSQGKFIYFSAPVFTTDLTPFNGLEKSTEVVYGNDEFSYKFEGNPFITAGAGLLKLLGDNNEISFYIQGNINAPFNFVINDPWDANTNLANTVAGEWVKFTLTREQVLNLVNNPSNFSVAIRDWSGGTRLFYISSYYEVK